MVDGDKKTARGQFNNQTGPKCHSCECQLVFIPAPGRLVHSEQRHVLFPQLDDCTLQLSHNGTYLDMESSLAEQRDELEGFQQDDTG